MIIKLVVPDHSCEGCVYLKPKTKDHNYYGEASHWNMCSVFDTVIKNHEKCSACTNAACKNETINTTVNEVEHLVVEVHNHAVNELTEKFKMVFTGKHLEDLIDRIADSCRVKGCLQ